MRADFGVVLDACVLLPMPLADTLLRVAEQPRLYIPQWTDEIMSEVSRNLISKFGLTSEKASYREQQLRAAFPSAWINDTYKLLIPAMPNQSKDRHVLAASVPSKSEVIVTYNKKHFPDSALSPFGVTCKGPSAFLRDLYDPEPAIATRKLFEQAECIGLSLEDLLARMKPAIPGFVESFCEELRIELP